MHASFALELQSANAMDTAYNPMPRQNGEDTKLQVSAIPTTSGFPQRHENILYRTQEEETKVCYQE